MFSLAIRRPVAVSMFFLGLAILGIIGWLRIPVELMPGLGGDELFIQLYRPGSDPEVLERELMMPLEARLASIEGLAESRGKIQGASGSLSLRFDRGTDLGIRQLELQQLAADLQRGQPRGTMVQVYSRDFSEISRFVMVVQVSGPTDSASLRNVIEESVVPRLASVPGVSRVMVSGGATRELSVRLDPGRCAELGVRTEEVVSALSQAVGTQHYLGRYTEKRKSRSVILDGRPEGLVSLGETRIGSGRGIALRHLAELSIGPGRQENAFRINGRPAIGLIVFQEEGANLIALGHRLRERVGEIRRDTAEIGLDAEISFDASEMVEKQLDRLKRLGLSGFGVALLVLLLFLRRFESIAVVALAVPVSLLTAVALLDIWGLSLNLITLFGLAIGIGMLVDNSIVVYEAIERLMSRRLEPGEAVREGARRSFRAILAASATNAVVFLPVIFATEDSLTRGVLRLLAMAIVLPLLASVLVALGLVPLLARRWGVPAAEARIAREKRRRERSAGLPRADRRRELFSGLLVSGLRRPSGWISLVVASILVTVIIGVPWIAVSSAGQEAKQADELRLQLETPSSSSLESAGEVFTRLEKAAMDLEGVRTVESVFNEKNGTLTVKLVDEDARPPGVDVASLRERLNRAVNGIKGLRMRRAEDPATGGGRSGGMAGLFGGGAEEVRISGPDGATLEKLGGSIEKVLKSLPEVSDAWTGAGKGVEEIQVRSIPERLRALRLMPGDVLPVLGSIRREGMRLQMGYTLSGGEEIPVMLRSPEDETLNAVSHLRKLEVVTPEGPRPMGDLTRVTRMPPPPIIEHHNGRRESSIFYTLAADAPRTGPARQELDRKLAEVISSLPRPDGYVIDATKKNDPTSWFKKVLLPVLLLLFAVLALTFESLSMPFLVLCSLPLTLLGAVWILVFSGTPLGLMALVGVVALFGLTVNPAILLVDRMQEHSRGGFSPGASAVAAVRERVRPVLMTSCTTIAGLWPLALSSGREMEIWPPFATVIMGGLLSSTILTLLVIPVGFVLISKLDRLFGRLGPVVVLSWLGLTMALMTPLILGGMISTLRWQVVTTVLVAVLLLGAAALLFHRPEIPEPQGSPPEIDVRFLRKIYGRPGPVGRALSSGTDFARRVVEAGGDAVDPAELRFQVLAQLLVAAGLAVLAWLFEGLWWKIIFFLVAAALVGAALRNLRRARGHYRKEDGRVEAGGLENLLALLAPWTALAFLVARFTLLPVLGGERPPLPPFGAVFWIVILALIQLGRRSAERAADGLPMRIGGSLGALGRKISRHLFGLDLPREEVEALSTISFQAGEGMLGILGPNGAGKTTLLRILAGILDADLGRVSLGGKSLKELRRYLARWVGYLPQEFGLPENLSAREYLEYFALLYGIHEEEGGATRVEDLLREVGLEERADEKIGAFSGGMKQRVAVARTLLRLPSIIIVDEPTVGLDPRERIRFRNLLGRLAKGRIVLFSTHVVEDVAVICERVLVLRRGELVFDGRVSELSERAESLVWKVVVSDDVELDGKVVERSPAGDGKSRLRILSRERPHPEAELLRPSLEDGYLVLTEGVD